MRPEWSKQVLASLKLNFHQGCPKLIYGHFYYVKVQSIPSLADFELAIGMNLHAYGTYMQDAVYLNCVLTHFQKVYKNRSNTKMSKKKERPLAKKLFNT